MRCRGLASALLVPLLLAAAGGCSREEKPKIVMPTGTYADPGRPVMVGGGAPATPEGTTSARERPTP
jgi:hypothetical protein